MTCSAHCRGIDETFDQRVADADLERYRSKGPSPSTRQLLDAIREAGIDGATVLDVGGGIGTIALELIDAGATHSTVVDASAAYVAAARDEAQRRRAAERIDVLHGDFIVIASGVEAADVVTLDEVVCCYPDMEPLLEASATSARRLYGIVYPRDAWWVRLAVRAENVVRRLRGESFRTYLFPNAEIEDAIRRHGHSLLRRNRGFFWVVDLYGRTSVRR